jgi:hypothetical protein
MRIRALMLYALLLAMGACTLLATFDGRPEIRPLPDVAVADVGPEADREASLGADAEAPKDSAVDGDGAGDGAGRADRVDDAPFRDVADVANDRGD